MMKKIPICICGGGNLAHALAGVIGMNSSYEVRVLSRQPERWSNEISVFNCDGTLRGRGLLSAVSAKPVDVVVGANIILVALPSYARAEVLSSIVPFIKPGAMIGSFPGVGGFDWMVKRLLSIKELNLAFFSAQRVPYICRTLKYGEAVMAEPKEAIHIALSSVDNNFKDVLKNMLRVRVNLLNSFLEVNLSNSNPLLHPARMYALFENYQKGRFYKAQILFYEDWDKRSSEVLISMDNELQLVCKNLPRSCNITPILKHYGVEDSQALTEKIKSIPSFKGILTPMVHMEAGYVPDFKSRHFTEDIPFGTLVIKHFAEKHGLFTPMIDKVVTWAQQWMGKEYLKDNLLQGSSCEETVLPYIQ